MSPRRVFSRVSATALVLLTAGTAGVSPQAGFDEPRRQVSPGPSRECHYSLAARVRPLLFWVGKSNVGEGRISWLAGEQGHEGYELLIGSLPDRAPRKINRWGYISEVRQGPEVRTFGFMTEVDEETYEQAEKTTGIPPGSRLFKVIRGTVGEGEALSGAAGLPLPETLTLRDLDVVSSRTPATLPSKRVALPPGTQPGFLFAMASLLRENVDTWLKKGVPPKGTARSYVFGDALYDVTTTSSRLLKNTKVRDRQFTNVMESQFEARRRGKSDGGNFRLVYGTEGTLREIPVRIVYRPKWWFEADLALTGGTGEP